MESMPLLTNLAEIRYGSVLEAAEAYTRAGIRVTPLNGKKPILDGWQDRLLDVEDLADHFRGRRNVGGLLGERSGGLADADLDVRQAVVAADALLPGTLSYGRDKNPRSHRLYVCDPAPRSKAYCLTKAMAADLGFGSEKEKVVIVELRADGRQSALPPSVHPEDRDVYAFCGDAEIWRIDGRELEVLVREVATATLLSLYSHRGRRQAFFLAAAGFLGRHLADDRVEAILGASAAASGDEEDEKRSEAVRDTLEKLREAEAAVTGGPALEELAPGVPALLAKWWGWRGTGRNGGRGGRKGDGPPPTHDELRDRWFEGHPHTAFGLGAWHRYGGGVWRPLGELMVEREISEALEAAKPEGVRPSASLLSSVERLARAKAHVPDEEWDAKADVLVCANGALEISSGVLREHRPEDYCLGAVPYAFDPDASAPTWERYLESTVPEAAAFLQEFAGYALTVETHLEAALWLHGPPGTGKSTFIEGLKAVLGPRAGVLGLADVQRNRFALANLPGKTLVVATEQPSDFISSSHLLNALISGEEITVEKKFRDAFSLVPRAKILWAMNDLPRVGDANSGLFRRVKVVSFPRLEGKPDPGVKRRIRAEGAGILNWSLEGLARLRGRGRFEVPGCVRGATEEFRRTNDVPALFVEEACVRDPNRSVQAAKLYQAYALWCRMSGHKALSATSVSKEWARLGFEKKTLNGRTFYWGLERNPKWIEQQTDLF